MGGTPLSEHLMLRNSRCTERRGVGRLPRICWRRRRSVSGQSTTSGGGHASASISLPMRTEAFSVQATLDSVRSSPNAAGVADVCISFNGGAWRGSLYLGVVEYLQTHYPANVLNGWHFVGVSSGACYALALAMDFPVEQLRTLVCTAASTARSHRLGVAFRVDEITGQVILDIIATVPEEELMRRLHGRFALAYSEIGCCGKARARLAYNFTSKAELYNAFSATGHIPFYSSLKHSPRMNGCRCMDGVFTSDGAVPLLPGAV